MEGKHGRRILLAFAFLVGLVIFTYPTLSDYIARQNITKGANTYNEKITQLSDEEIEQMWKEARAYNDSLNGTPVPDPFIPGSGRVLPENYLRVLNMEDGIMGYVNIPDIRVYLPIRHGVTEETLEKGAGHIEQTTLPIGGIGNLSVITAHTGHTGAEMFNRLIDLVAGDTFMIHVLDETFTYEVDDIRVILPDEIESLLPVEGEDYVTLVTCTPYGVNSHRLLVRGTRIPNVPDIERVTETVSVFPWRLLFMILIAIFLVTLVLIWNKQQDKKVKNTEKDIEAKNVTEAEIQRTELLRKIKRDVREREIEMKKT